MRSLICLCFKHCYMSGGWDVKWCRMSSIHVTTPLAHKRPFLWILRGVGSWGPPVPSPIIYPIVAAVTWLKYCRYGAGPQSINQSINQSNIAIGTLENEWSKFGLVLYSPFKTLLKKHVIISNHTSFLPLPERSLFSQQVIVTRGQKATS